MSKRLSLISFFFQLCGSSKVKTPLGFHLDEKLDFNAHIEEKFSIASRGIDIIKRLQNKLP